MFPLVQLPKKFKGSVLLFWFAGEWFPLVQLPKKFKGSTTRSRTEEEQFPLVQLPKKFKAKVFIVDEYNEEMFPLVQLPKKFKGPGSETPATQSFYTPLFAGGINFCKQMGIYRNKRLWKTAEAYSYQRLR